MRARAAGGPGAGSAGPRRSAWPRCSRCRARPCPGPRSRGARRRAPPRPGARGRGSRPITFCRPGRAGLQLDHGGERERLPAAQQAQRAAGRLAVHHQQRPVFLRPARRCGGRAGRAAARTCRRRRPRRAPSARRSMAAASPYSRNRPCRSFSSLRLHQQERAARPWRPARGKSPSPPLPPSTSGAVTPPAGVAGENGMAATRAAKATSPPTVARADRSSHSARHGEGLGFAARHPRRGSAPAPTPRCAGWRRSRWAGRRSRR